MQKDFTEIPFTSSFIPFSAQIDPYTIISKTGEISQIVKVNPSSNNNFHTELNNAYKEVIKQGATIGIYATFLPNNDNNETTTLKDFLQISQHKHIYPQNKNKEDFYIVISIKAYSINHRNIINFLLQNRFFSELNDSIQKLHKIVNNFCTSIKKYYAKILSTYILNQNHYSEQSSFLYKLFLGTVANVPLLEAEISEQINASSIKHCKNYLILQRGKTQKFISCLTIKSFPHTNIINLAQLYRLKNSFVISQTIHKSETKDIQNLFGYQYQISQILKENSISQKCGWDKIINQSDEAVCMQTNITIHSNTLEEMQQSINYIIKTLNEAGIIAIREDINCENAFYATLPTNYAFLNRLEYTTIDCAGQFVLSKNIMYNEIKYIINELFIPLLGINEQYYALSPFYANETHHIIIHGKQMPNLTIFINVILLHLQKKYPILSIENNYSGFSLNKICNGRYYQNISINIVNLLKFNKKNFFILFAHCVSYYCNLHQIKISQELNSAIRDLCLNIKEDYTFNQILELTSNEELRSGMMFLKNCGLFEEEDVIHNSSTSSFTSINADDIPNDLYSIYIYYVLAIKPYVAKEYSILKIDRTLEVFNNKILGQKDLTELLTQCKKKNIAVIMCVNLPTIFETSNITTYSQSTSLFGINIFSESFCTVGFVKKFFQLDNRTTEKIMFVKEGTGNIVVKTPHSLYNIQLQNTIPLRTMQIFNQLGVKYGEILKIIENNNESCIKDYTHIINI